MRYEVVIKSGGIERVIRGGIRRENGAIAERDIAADSEYRNKMKRIEGDPFAHVVRGSDAKDPNAEVIVYFDAIATVVSTVTYRPAQGEQNPEPDTLADDLLASIYALDMGASL